MATTRGLDVSAYQGTQDWAAHKRDGVVFAFAKASEGQSTHDSRFATHIKGIVAAGLVPGAYHFAWPNQSAAKEAANYVAAVKPHAGKGFTHWLDLERYSDGRNYQGRSAAQIKAYAAAWIAAVSKAFPGQRVGVYTSGSDLSAGHVPAGTPLWYPSYPWGAAAYTKAEAATRPAPSGWKPLFWQFTSQPLDRSICYMSAADLRTWAGSTQAPPAVKVSLKNLVAAAKADPSAPQGHTTHPADVKIYEAALRAEGLLAATYAGDGSFGTTAVNANSAWQKAYSKEHNLGWAGADVNGIPGKTSATALGVKHGFTVVS